MTEARYRFFCEDIDRGFLSEEESVHALRVLRLRESDPIELIDGRGRLAKAVINGGNKKQLSFSVNDDVSAPAPAYDIHIAIAPTKNIDRFAFFLEKVTEIGITRITPLITKNSERKELKIDKLKKNLIAAIKQSGHLFIPEIDGMTDYRQFISAGYDREAAAFIAWCGDDGGKTPLKDRLRSREKVVILIGPEGDFTPEEVNLAKQSGFLPVSLGESRLRTETAGIVACHTVHLIQP